MRLQYRRFLSFFLLVTFAGISLLGEGLHWLTPEIEQHVHHHHGHGVCIVMHATHGARRDDHDAHLADSVATSADNADCESCTKSMVALSDCDFDSHVCKICEFLFQAVSQPIEVVAPFEWQPLVVSTSSLQGSICSTISPGIQAPRGPPSLV
jgi:hypothetical protein